MRDRSYRRGIRACRAARNAQPIKADRHITQDFCSNFCSKASNSGHLGVFILVACSSGFLIHRLSRVRIIAFRKRRKTKDERHCSCPLESVPRKMSVGLVTCQPEYSVTTDQRDADDQRPQICAYSCKVSWLQGVQAPVFVHITTSSK